MKTGEGKTLVGTAPVYLNALSGKGVHVVTVNDYLANVIKKRWVKFMNFRINSRGYSSWTNTRSKKSTI